MFATLDGIYILTSLEKSLLILFWQLSHEWDSFCLLIQKLKMGENKQNFEIMSCFFLVGGLRKVKMQLKEKRFVYFIKMSYCE